MNIFFTASILQKKDFGQNYQRIVKFLQSQGHKVVHEHVTGTDLDDIKKLSEQETQDYYYKVQRWISDADLVIAEVSFPSTLNIGHQVSQALEKGKPVICLYQQGKISIFYQAIKNDKLIYEEYTVDTLEEVLREALELAQSSADTRFNFLISPSLLEYLDWVAKNRRIPRSVYLRKLIEADRDKQKDYTH